MRDYKIKKELKYLEIDPIDHYERRHSFTSDLSYNYDEVNKPFDYTDYKYKNIVNNEYINKK